MVVLAASIWGRWRVLKESLGCGGLIRLLLDHGAVEGCLALHVGQHNFAELLHLLRLLIGHLGGHVHHLVQRGRDQP